MSSALFVNGNLHGHINPTLPLVKELAERGEDVWYFCADAFAEKVRAAGAHFISSGEAMEDFYRRYRPTGNHPFYTLIEYIANMDRVLIPSVLEKTRGMKFDYMVYDAMLGGGKILGAKMSLPAICSCSSFAMNRLPVPESMLIPGSHPQLDAFYEVLRQTYEEWGAAVPGVLDVFFKKGDINLVYTSKLFQPDAGSYDESFRFVGPSIRQREEPNDFPLEKILGKKTIYISLGTINTRHADFYQRCMDALAEYDGPVVLSVGNKTDPASFHAIPANFIVRSTVPQLEVLQNAVLMISHGGLNSVSEALYYGVPVLSVPTANDQFLVTRQLTSVGAGFGIKMEEATATLLQDSMQRILSDPGFRQAAKTIGNSFREAGGYQAAADAVLRHGRAF